MDSKKLMSMFKELSNDERLFVFSELFDCCSASLLSEIEGLVKLKKKRDFISNLPQDAADIIVSYLDIRDLASAQLVCKRWRQAITGRKTFLRLACERLDISESEYETEKQAVAVCRYVWQKNASLDNWFSRILVDFELGSRNVGLHYAELEGRDYLIITSNTSGIAIIECFNDPTSEERVNVSVICTLLLPYNVSCLKFLGVDAIICGSYVGFIERRNTSSALVVSYWQHGGAVLDICANKNRDILFSAGADHSVNCWRFSTGELLHVVDSFEYWAVEIKLKPVCNAADPLIVAVLVGTPPIMNLPAAENGIAQSLDSLAIFSWSDNDRELVCLYSIDVGPQRSGVIRSITSTLEGFRFVFVEDGTDLYVCNYVAETNSIQRQKVLISGGDRIRRVLAVGTKYSLITKLEGLHYLNGSDLFEKEGSVWVPSGYRVTDEMHDFQYVRNGECSNLVLGNEGWLNGLRPMHVGRLAFATVTESSDSIEFAFLK